MAESTKRVAKVNEFIRFKANDGNEYTGLVFAIYNNSVGVFVEGGIYLSPEKQSVERTVVNHKHYSIIN